MYFSALALHALVAPEARVFPVKINGNAENATPCYAQEPHPMAVYNHGSIVDQWARPGACTRGFIGSTKCEGGSLASCRMYSPM